MAEVEYKVLMEEDENGSALTTLFESLDKHATCEGTIKLNVGPVTAKYDEKANLWWQREDKFDEPTYYWNNFGRGKPRWDEPMSSTIELNISRQYTKNGRSVGGAMVRDNNGIDYLAHKGTLGGGNVKAGFVEYYARKKGSEKYIKAEDHKGTRELILITEIQGDNVNVSKNIAGYLEVVEEYKQGPGRKPKSPKDDAQALPSKEEHATEGRKPKSPKDDAQALPSKEEHATDDHSRAPISPPPPKPWDGPTTKYSIDNIEGCFLEKKDLETILNRLKSRKNLILQGPPGTGKTWLAKKLAFALIGSKDKCRVQHLQFHPNLSYEDFVRGWRPGGDGKLTLRDGPLLEAIKDAKKEPESKIVLVIEEINRGNPATIFGEMLTLLEADKRKEEHALTLSYAERDERVYIPDNLYIIGTMNVADRSLAMVDFALRRRFFFHSLEPMLGDKWRDWVSEQCGIDTKLLEEIGKRLDALNKKIAGDRLLGPQYKIGHSYVTPRKEDVGGDPEKWFKQVVETEIGPQLEEYWFEDQKKSRDAKTKLLEEL